MKFKCPRILNNSSNGHNGHNLRKFKFVLKLDAPCIILASDISTTLRKKV